MKKITIEGGGGSGLFLTDGKVSIYLLLYLFISSLFVAGPSSSEGTEL